MRSILNICAKEAQCSESFIIFDIMRLLSVLVKYNMVDLPECLY